MSQKTKSILDTIEAKGPDTKTETITKTVVCTMETSQKKNKILREGIETFQKLMSHLGDVFPSYDEYQWGRKTEGDKELQREFPEIVEDKLLYSANRQEAADHVSTQFKSWKSNGKVGDYPTFGDGNFINIRNDYVKLSKEEGNYGVQLGIKQNNKIWWGLRVGEYQRNISDSIIDGDFKHGSAEVHLEDNGSARLHQTYKFDVEVYKKPELDRWLGVDRGVKKMWVASPVEEDGPVGAAVFDQKADEFRANRERLSKETTRLQENDDLNAVKARRERRNYTDTMTHIAAHEIVEMAAEYRPCGIALEDLVGYRGSADNAIHDWPYADLREKIMYKANERGIPVKSVNSYYSSQECWKCGTAEYTEKVDRDTLVCSKCGDERHADVNGAIVTGLRAF